MLEKSIELRGKLKDKERLKIVKDIINKARDNLIYIDGGIIIHNMYNMEYTGLGYNVAQKEIKDAKKLRIFENGDWRYATPEDEKKYLDYLKKSQKTAREKIDWNDIKYNYYGYRDVDDKFKIIQKPLEGKRPTKGSVCIQSSWPELRLYKLLIHLNYIPETDEYQDYSRKELIKSIISLPKLSIFKDGINERSTKELRGILALNLLKKYKICDQIEQWFKDNDLFIDYRI